MFSIENPGARLCDGISRRDWLSVGSLGALGLSLPTWFQSRAVAAESSGVSGRVDRSSRGIPAKACIQIFLWGGPGAQETWDLKPGAPLGMRGDFKPISTSVPGTHYCEHLPRLAQLAHRYTIIRSQTHTGVNHGTSSYHMLTGHIHPAPGTLKHPEKTDMPNLGSNAARFLSHPSYLPGHVHLPAIINDGDGLPVPGQGSGILGESHEPFQVLGDLTKRNFRVPALALQAGMDRGRLARRIGLQKLVQQHADHLGGTAAGRAVDSTYEHALNLLQSEKTDRAFDLSREKETTRERYGYHHFAQGLLLARRLVEAGVPFVTVYWNSPRNTDNQSWDTHNNQHERMRDHLLPPFDRALSALLEDLVARGMLDETLVTWWGEFGRTPKINRIGGRDHWGFCQSVGLAGGGIRPGMTYGTSTADGGYAETNPVRPDDLAATVLFQLGIDHKQHMYDLQQRPHPLAAGEPVRDILL